MKVDEIVRYLEAVEDRPTFPQRDAVAAQIALGKASAVQRGAEEEAKELWILESVLQAQTQYLEALQLLDAKQFYDAWCMLERCEITLGELEKHEQARWSLFRLDFISEYVAKWQSIFPYKMFLSPEFIEREKKCSICGRPVLPRTDCGHRLGYIYGGRMCYHIVTRLDPVSVSLVENPVQKYSVAFANHPVTGEKGDHYNYSTVEYARSIIQSPFDPWIVERTRKLWPHSHFTHVGRNDRCPCGSAKKYKKCCLPNEGVLMPHFQFHISKQLPAEVPSSVLSLPRL